MLSQNLKFQRHLLGPKAVMKGCPIVDIHKGDQRTDAVPYVEFDCEKDDSLWAGLLFFVDCGTTRLRPQS